VRILLVEDDPQLSDSTARALRSQGWVVDCTERGEPVAVSVRQDPYDLLILDVGLAGIDGFETLRRVRAQGSDLPVLMLTARDAIEDRVRGLESGADDYLVKPFALSELVARSRALVRRNQARGGSVLSLGSLRMDLEARRAYIGEQELALGWDGAGGRWAVLGAAEERRLSQEQARAIEVLAGARRPLTPREAAPLLGKTVGAAGVLLWRMAERGLLVSENGAYAPAGLPLPAPGASAKRFPAGEGSKD